MAEPTTLAIGLKTSELTEDIRKRLFYLSSNYECHFVDILDFTQGSMGIRKKIRKQQVNMGKELVPVINIMALQ